MKSMMSMMHMIISDLFLALFLMWAEARDSMHAALLALIGKPAPQLFYRSALKRPRAVMRRWMMNLVRIS
jgi:hypothetical protein